MYSALAEKYAVHLTTSIITGVEVYEVPLNKAYSLYVVKNRPTNRINLNLPPSQLQQNRRPDKLKQEPYLAVFSSPSVSRAAGLEKSRFCRPLANTQTASYTKLA